MNLKITTSHLRSCHASPALRRLLVVAVAAGLTTGLTGGLAVAGAAAGPASTSGSPDWTSYLKGSAHNSYAPLQQAITTANAAKITSRWHDFPKIAFQASPTVDDGAVYVGSTQGWFYELKATTGAVLHKTFLGLQPKKTCRATGIVSTATVASSPSTHQATVYVAAPDGYLYALQASNLALEWKSAIAIPSTKISNYFDWSSPTVANGTIYVGVSSNCDSPMIRGGEIAYNQANGKKLAEFYTVPKGKVGGSVWSSAAVVPGGDVFVSTGDGPESSVTTQLLGDSESILKLAPRTLKLLGNFQIPADQVIKDSDFGASPVIAGGDVGACNKNGIFYMLNRSTMKVVWEERVGDAGTTSDNCIAAPAVDGRVLYVGGVGWKIGSTSYHGSVQERDVATGDLVWQTGLAGEVLGSLSLDGGGVLTVPIYSSNPKVPSLYLVDAATGRILKRLAPGSQDFGQGVYAENMLFSSNAAGVTGWR
jgi:outer membrane protein assembly factor BamB